MDIDGPDSGPLIASASNDPDGSSKTRKRVSRACDRCRAKKDKCDGARPSCSACVASDQICSYGSSTKKRGLPEGYVRGLEKLWALSMGKIEGLEDTVSSSIMVEHKHELLESWNHDVVGEDLHMIWKESKILHELESLLAGLECVSDTPPSLKKKREREAAGSEDSDHPFHRQPEYHIGTGAVSEQSTTKPPHKRRRISQRLSESELHQTPLPPTASNLLLHYFSYTHCWFPIVEKHQILRTSYEYSKKERHQPRSNADLAALWAILAYTARQTSQKDPLTAAEEDRDMILTPEEMRVVARSLIPDERGPFSVGHVQALLLIALLDIGLGEWKSAWVLVGHASRIALELGLGSAASEERGICVLQGCFILDTLVAIHLMRCPHLRRQDIEAAGYLNEDGHEEWDTWTSPYGADSHREPAFTISCFNRMVDILLIMNDMACENRARNDRQMLFQARSQLLHAIQNKFSFSMSLSQLGPPHHVYLQLFHLAASIFLLRQSFAGGAPLDSLASSACDILNLLTRYAQNPAFGPHTIPPTLETVVRSACYAAIAARPSFDSFSGLLSYDAFTTTMTEHLTRISPVWPAFKFLADIWHRDLQTVEASNRGPPSRNEDSLHQVLPHLGSSSSYQTRSLSSHTGNDLTNINTAMPTSVIRHVQSPRNDIHTPFLPTARNQSLHGRTRSSTGFPSETRKLDHGIAPMMERDSMLDMPMSGIDASISSGGGPAGLAMPVSGPSPSFHEDDVDAIFHHIVHLDTTEWTDDREQQRLKDFGFADDVTFQAFCNDPERFVPAGGDPSSDQPSSYQHQAVDEFWPPAVGFFPGNNNNNHLPGDEPDPHHLEASQILHSLFESDQFPKLPERVGW